MFSAQKKFAKFRTSPYNPPGNGRKGRYSGFIRKAVSCSLDSRKFPQNHSGAIFGKALFSIRGLPCTSSNETPHWRLLQFPQKDYRNFIFPDWFFQGNTAYLRNFIRCNSDTLVEAVKIIDVINECSSPIS